LAGIPEWLFEISREFVGDLAETIALLLPAPTVRTDQGLHYWVVDRLLPLGAKSPDERREAVLNAWNSLAGTERFLFNKLLTGGFRVGVSRRLVIRGLADFCGLPADVIAHRLMGHWQPTADFFRRIPCRRTTLLSCRACPGCSTGILDWEWLWTGFWSGSGTGFGLR
jgi:DNA ligase-1